MTSPRSLKIGMVCYPTVGGSGVLASALGEELVARGHEVHFFSYERPFRLPLDVPGLHFHRVEVSTYALFKYPDYTLPLSVRMEEVTRQHGLDLLHVHYAVPHATAAILTRAMLPPEIQPKIVTTLHGTDTTLLGRDPGYMSAIRHALNCSDAVTSVSQFLKEETHRLLSERPIEVIRNFFTPRGARRSRDEIRRELGLDRELLLYHSSNLRPPKRVDLLLEAVARLRTRVPFKLLILAGDDFAPFEADVRRLKIEDRIIVRTKVPRVEEYLEACDLGLFTSELESFGLSILEGMWFGCPSVAMRVGGIPEVIDDGATGLLTPFPDVDAFVSAVDSLLGDEDRRRQLGRAAQASVHQRFSADAIVPRYEALYRAICG